MDLRTGMWIFKLVILKIPQTNILFQTGICTRHPVKIACLRLLDEMQRRS
jgi:hypothetical protein